MNGGREGGKNGGRVREEGGREVTGTQVLADRVHSAG